MRKSLWMNAALEGLPENPDGGKWGGQDCRAESMNGSSCRVRGVGPCVSLVLSTTRWGGTPDAWRGMDVVMIEALLSQPSFVAASKMLDATAMRHEAIASNLANLATPGYRRVDLNPTFDTELRQALGSGDVAALNRLQPKIEADASARVEGPNGNSVQLEDELMYMSQNMMAHSLNVQIVNGSIDRLKMAITGRQA